MALGIAQTAFDAPAVAAPGVIRSDSRRRLRLAIQKSGRLAHSTFELLSRAGFAFRDEGELLRLEHDKPIELLLVRDDDIPALVASGACDTGIVGRNVLREFALARPGCAALAASDGLGFGQCRLALAIPRAEPWRGPASLAGRRIATSYPRLLRAWLAGQGIEAEIVTMSGSVEIAPRLGAADLVCDLVQSGATLEANGLREVRTLLQSEAVLVAPAATPAAPRAGLLALLRQSLLAARAGQSVPTATERKMA